MDPHRGRFLGCGLRLGGGGGLGLGAGGARGEPVVLGLKYVNMYDKINISMFIYHRENREFHGEKKRIVRQRKGSDRGTRHKTFLYVGRTSSSPPALIPSSAEGEARGGGAGACGEYRGARLCGDFIESVDFREYST